jgi:hypothetical protein
MLQVFGGFIMNTSSNTGLHALLALIALLFVAAGSAWADPISIRYAGTGFDTAYDNGEDGLPIDISLADAKGSFGASKMEVAAEFMPPLEDVDCAPGYDVALGISFVSSVITFEKMDQLIGFSWHNGWMCVNPTTGHHYGHGEGNFINGTGRFAGATGTWVADYEGFNLEPGFLISNPVGWRTFTGVMTGDVIFPTTGD